MMSSGISTDVGRLKPAPETGRLKPAPAESFEAWHFFVLASILLATVAVVLTRRSAPEHLILLSFTVAAAGGVAAALYRMLLPLVRENAVTFETTLTERGRLALEREKMLALRAIKDLEFDRAMRKLSQDDFDEMATRLRQRAISVMKQLDDGVQYREIIEKELDAWLAGRPKPASTGDAGRLPWPEQGRGQPACQCGTMNDSDAVFCKKCGTRLQAA